uniref:Uncharacterized protein n=1 Tax=Denticeps clupeoides TaxID=299321 RepID=A0AAY4BT06_9TELE
RLYVSKSLTEPSRNGRQRSPVAMTELSDDFTWMNENLHRHICSLPNIYYHEKEYHRIVLKNRFNEVDR